MKKIAIIFSLAILLVLVNSNTNIVDAIVIGDVTDRGSVILSLEQDYLDSSYGRLLDTDQSITVLGNPYYDGTAIDQGIVTVYFYNGTDYNSVTITASDAATSDEFGTSVSLYGTTLAVGAPKADGFIDNVGAVYIYDLSKPENNYNEQKIILDGSTTGNQNGSYASSFGFMVDIDDTALVVSAPNQAIKTPTADELGAVYIYDLSDLTVAPIEIFNSTPTSDANFGFNLVVDGTNLFVSSVDTNEISGTIQLFYYNLTNSALNYGETEITTTGTLVTDNALDYWAFDFDAEGNTLVVSAPEVSANGASAAGAVFVYDLANNLVTDTITPSVSSINGQFGISLALEGDNLVVGSSYAYDVDTTSDISGGINIFDLTSDYASVYDDVPIVEPFVTSEGYGSAVSINDNLIVVGRTGSSTINGGLNFISIGDTYSSVERSAGFINAELGTDPAVIDYSTVYSFADYEDATLTIVTDYSAIDNTTVGTYEVIVTATDDTLGGTENLITVTTIDVNITDVIAPVITRTAKSNTVEADELSTIDMSLFYTYSDNYDALGDLNIVYEGNTGIDLGLVGEHEITVTVTDTSGNSSTDTFTLIIVDSTSPTFDIVETYTFEVNEYKVTNPYNFEDDLTNVNDSYSPASDLKITIMDNALDYGSIGDYTVQVVVTDKNDNSNNQFITVTIEDTTNPVYTYSSIVNVEKDSEPIDWETYSTITSATDNSGIAVIYDLISDDVNYEVEGFYTIVMKVTDNSGNSVLKQISIHIIDNAEEDTTILGYIQNNIPTVISLGIVLLLAGGIVGIKMSQRQ